MAGSNGKEEVAKPKRITVPQRMMNLLSDGRPHTLKDMEACLEEDVPPLDISPHLTALRKALRPRGEDILCRREGNTTWYSHVRIVNIA